MEKEEVIERIILSSIPIRQIGESRYPIDSASAVVVEYRSTKFLLTVFHAVKDTSNWCVEIKSDFINGTKLNNLGVLGKAVVADLETETITEIDFAYRTMPSDFKSFYQIVENGVLYESERYTPQLSTNLNINGEMKFGFFGQAKFTRSDRVLIIPSKLVLDMKYERSDDFFHYFKLPVKHPGHEHLRGTSGAPIFDYDGNLVSLVCGGDDKQDLVYGLNLNNYIKLLDTEL